MSKSNLRKNLKLKPSQLVKKRKQQLIFKVSLYSVFFISLIIGLSSLSRADFMTVDRIEVNGLGFLKESQITKIVSEKTKGNVLWIFPKTNIFLYPKDQIKTEILKAQKRVYQAKVSLKDFSYLDISIEERIPFAFWCKGENLDLIEERSENCFILDKFGFVFDEADNLDLRTNSKFVRYFGTLKNKNILGSRFLNKEKFASLTSFFDLISTTFDVNPKVVRKENSTLEISLDSGSVLKILIEDDFEKVFENLVTLLSDPEFQKTTRPLSLFEHIDLRFGQKVFYKLR